MHSIYTCTECHTCIAAASSNIHALSALSVGLSAVGESARSGDACVSLSACI